jgi:anti-sigma regulatory factor (Ser/Thr protein kinase)
MDMPRPAARLPAGGQIRRLTLVGVPGAVGRSRGAVREALRDWQWLPGETEEQQAAAEDALLVACELVTNACLHAGGATELVLHCTTERLRIEVGDNDPTPPAPRLPHRAGRPGGHGLHIVARLAGDWGSEPRPGGKTVWAEFPTPTTPEPTPSRD